MTLQNNLNSKCEINHCLPLLCALAEGIHNSYLNYHDCAYTRHKQCFRSTCALAIFENEIHTRQLAAGDDDGAPSFVSGSMDPETNETTYR